MSGLNQCDPKNAGAPPSCLAGVGNPIHAGTGNKYQIENDYQGVGLFPLRFDRYYNSNGSSVKGGALGPVWRHSYERSVNAYTASNATYAMVARPDGKSYYFTLASSIWTSPDSDVSDTLVRLTDTAGNPTGWRYTTAANDETETFDATGKLVTIANHAGLMQTLTYSDATTPTSIAPVPGLLIRVTDTFGRQLNFTYDSTQRLTTLADPAGGLYTYGYDANNNLASMTHPDSQVLTYLYNESAYTSNTNLPNALTGIVDENGNRFATFNYDTQGRAISSEHAGGTEKVTLAYNADGTTTVTDAFTATNPLGTAHTYNFQKIFGVVKTGSISQPCTGCGSSVQNLSYDANGNVASTADFNGNLTCYAYDLNRNLETARVEGIAPGGTCPANLSSYTPAANAVERKILTQWHATYRLPTRIVEPGRLKVFAYFANGTLQTKTVTDTVLNKSRSWNYTYDANGQLKTEDGPRTDVADITTYTYYLDTTSTHTLGDLQTITDALGHVTTFTQYDKHGRPQSLTDPNGLVVGLTYDALGRLKTRTVGGNTTRFGYYPNGLLHTLTQPDLSTYTYSYDAAHRLTKIVDNLGNEIDYTPDNLGNVTQQVSKNPDGTVAKTQSAVFDPLNRLQQTLGAQSQTTQFGYYPDGSLKTVIDPKNHPATTYVYDALDRLRQVQDAAAGITQYGYDGLDQLNQVTAPNGASTSYTVDALGNRLAETSPDRGTLQATYDEAGNRKTRTDARGIIASYSYDALNRLILVSYPTVGENIIYTYDTGTGCSNGLGRLCQVQDGDGATTFAYDSQGNLLQQVRTEAGLNYTTGYGYDSVNRIGHITPPGNLTVSYSRDAIGNIYGIATPINGVATWLANAIQTNALGQVTYQTFANGYSESRGYNTDGQAASASQALVAGTGGGGTQQVPLPDWALAALALALALRGARYGRQHGKHFAVFLIMGASLLLSGLLYSAAAYAPITLHYDANGNLDQRIDGSGTTNYSYDALDRLGNETGPIKTQTFGYDGDGNRTSDGGGSYTYPANSNRLQTAHGQAIAADPSGNITGDGVNTYVYNQAGQLAQVKKGTFTVVSYGYDYRGQRTRKQAGATTTLYHYDQSGHLIAESDTSGNILRTYVWRDDTPYAQIESSSGRDQVYYLEVDTLNTPRTARDQTGTIVWQWYSDAFGSTLPNEDPDGNGVLTHINLRFPGQYFDGETGLYYNMARYYDPGKGRYLQSDPVGLAGGVNTYTYVRNSPINRIDFLGLYELLNCNASQAKNIYNATCAAQDAANKLGIGDQISRILDVVTFECSSENYCGLNKEPSLTKDYVNHNIGFSKSAINSAKQCGPLKSTILHELSHSYPLHYNEGDAFILERSAFQNINIPTPEQFKNSYRELSNQIYQDYTNKYNKVIGQ